jgi:hypothetical protein
MIRSILVPVLFWLGGVFRFLAAPIYRVRMRQQLADFRIVPSRIHGSSNIAFMVQRADGARFVAKIENPILGLYHRLEGRRRAPVPERAEIVRRLRAQMPQLRGSLPETMSVGDILLCAYLDEAVPLTAETSPADLPEQLGAIVESWHAAGYVHGDIKQKNVLVLGSQLVLIDFDDVQASTPSLLALEDRSVARLLAGLR